MLAALRVCLVVLGASAVIIALSILILGAEATASISERVFNAASGRYDAPIEHWPATMDSELRFYAALWGGYGLLVLRTAWSLSRSLAQVPWLAGVFLVGGLGRVLSRASVGAPHPFFTLLMVIELCLPVLMTLLWLRVRAPRPPGL